MDGGVFDIVDSFTYLGSNISRDGEAGTEVSSRLAKAARAFGCLRRFVFFRIETFPLLLNGRFIIRWCSLCCYTGQRPGH